MSKLLTAQHLFEVLQVLPEEDRKHMKIVVADIDDERSDISDYVLCVSRVILKTNRSFKG